MTQAHIELDPTHRDYNNDEDVDIDQVIARSLLKAAGWTGSEAVDGSIFDCDAVYFYCAQTGRASAQFVPHSSLRGAGHEHLVKRQSISLGKDGLVQIDAACHRELARDLLAQQWASLQNASPCASVERDRMHVVVRFDKRKKHEIVASVKVFTNNETVLPYWDLIQMVGSTPALRQLRRSVKNKDSFAHQ